jgi:drug/metabolite transporter (DMT)-like permease
MKKEEFNDINGKAIFLAVLAAALYGISAPVSKLLLSEVPPTLMAAFLYLGAGLGMLAVNGARKLRHKETAGTKLTGKELPYVIGMVLLDIAAPVFLMIGLTMTTSENAALLNNFEIVATALIALGIFKEAVGKRMWLAIVLITISSIVLSVEDYRSFSFSAGSAFVLLACVCWGFENNCTRMLSAKDSRRIVVIKGLGSGAGSLLISLALKQYSSNVKYLALTLLLGFVAYGLSIYFYIRAQRNLGAARTSAYYATAPFIGVLVSWLIFHDAITQSFLIALAIMLAGTYFAATEIHRHRHYHEAITHEHMHSHKDGHHNHIHEDGFIGEHCHLHAHEAVTHTHRHTPDVHHSHVHQRG